MMRGVTFQDMELDSDLDAADLDDPETAQSINMFAETLQQFFTMIIDPEVPSTSTNCAPLLPLWCRTLLYIDLFIVDLRYIERI